MVIIYLILRNARIDALLVHQTWTDDLPTYFVVLSLFHTLPLLTLSPDFHPNLHIASTPPTYQIHSLKGRLVLNISVSEPSKVDVFV